jgi:hypothetical protein
MQPPRCDACLENALLHLRSLARERGEDWASAVADQSGTAAPWPRYEGDTAALARRKIADLERRDARITEALARECYAWASHEWAMLRRQR